ncbi:MAG TPA: ATP-binding protein, partial [Herpetosiphonaceae bacterium]
DLAVREGFLASVAGETDRLTLLVNDLLLLSRAEAGALPPERAPTDIALLARERADRFAALAAGQGCRITVEAAGDALRAGADAHQLAQVLDNLLHNAIRHAPGGGIQVTVAGDGEHVRCCVADTGCGIPPAHLPHVFERFYRVDGSRARASGGSGLGLAITQALIQAHGGRIEAASPAGRGAQFTFWLPRAPD